MTKDEVIKYLDWYFLDDGEGSFDKTAVDSYKDLKKYIDQLEHTADRMYKIALYLLRKYKDDLMKEYGCENDELSFFLTVMDRIYVKMYKEMPELWYTYGIGRKEAEN